MFSTLDYPSSAMGNRPGFFSINKFLPFLLIYFFVNNVGLPHGLQYTTVLAPLFYVWLFLKREKFIVTRYVFVFFPFVIVQIIDGVNMYYYVRSYILLLLIYIVVYACATMLRRMHAPGRIFDMIIMVNFILACLALLVLNTSHSDPIWATDVITSGSEAISRLRLLTYEPSYYATLMVPFFVFALARVIRAPKKKNILRFILIAAPMLMAFSLGVIASLVIAIYVASLWTVKEFIRKKIIMLSIGIIIGIGFLFVQNSGHDILTLRVHNVLSGEDSSGNTRIYEADALAYELAKSTSIWWGAGFGQAKLMLESYITYSDRFIHQFRLTNVVASTFATFGIVGLLARFSLEVYLFFRIRVYASYFRLMLFLFMFVYQFTGSYLTNIAEYVVWVLAFTPLFPELEDKSSRHLLCNRVHKGNYKLVAGSGA